MDLLATAMVSALGYDVHTACAAARAGLARPSELPFLTLEADRSPGLATGHVARLLTDGFDGDARLVRLMCGALDDLRTQVPPQLLADTRTGFYLSIPAADREWQGLGLMATDERRERHLEQIGTPPSIDEATRGAALLGDALKLARYPEAVRAAARTVRVSAVGHAGTAALCHRAARDLESGTIDMAVIGAVDSLAGHRTLTWLSATGRLKSAESPAGLAPGEAAAFLLFAAAGRLPWAEIPARASLDTVTLRVSDVQLLDGGQADGRAQAEIVRELTGSLGVADTDWVVTDQNGELFRAVDWGTGLTRLRGAGVTIRDSASIWYPASSFGDTGAAAGAVATCIASEALLRGYARERHAILLASSDGAARAGWILSTRN
ncbi:MAG: hypothetical protein QM736_28340 [Vicinamibacterales bacterium]